MKTDAQSSTPKKAARTLDDEIAALQERLARLQSQKREKERKELERNQKAITALLRSEKLDTVPIEKWTEALPALRKLLKVAAPNGASSSPPLPSPRPEQAVTPAKADQGATPVERPQTGNLEATGQTP